jgi:hypothetical protein
LLQILVPFYIPVNTVNIQKNKDNDREQLLCKKHSTYNREHQQARAHVEAPNAIIKSDVQFPFTTMDGV